MMTDEQEFDIDTLADLLDEVENEGPSPDTKSKSDTDILSVKDDQGTKNNIDENSNKNALTSRVLRDAPLGLFSSEGSNVPDMNASDSKNVSSKQSHVHSGETDSSEDEENKYCLTESGKTIKKKIGSRKSYDKPQRLVIKTWRDTEKDNLARKNMKSSNSKETHVVDEYSGIRIIQPLVPYDVLKSRMVSRRMIKMSFIRNFMKKGDIEGDWVTMGVLVNKVPPKTSKNGKTFSIWKMNDLVETEKLVSVFLFGAAHTEHWKTSVGTVVGILNPSILPDQESGKFSNSVSLSVDHPGKFMMMGISKDFGQCKSVRKDGSACSAIVNKSKCEFCTYHVSKEYKKFSGKRMDLQATFSGRQPSLKQKILKGQNVMYGGQMFAVSSGKAGSQQKSFKDKLTLSNLQLKRKAEKLEAEERSKSTQELAELYGVEDAKSLENQSSFINQQLAVPTAGSRNLFHHLVKSEKTEDVKKRTIVSVTPKELLKMHECEMKAKRLKLQNGDVTSGTSRTASSLSSGGLKLPNSSPSITRSFQTTSASIGEKHQSNQAISSTFQGTTKESGTKLQTPSNSISPQNSGPRIGVGFQPGDEICFELGSAPPKNHFSPNDYSKMRAIQKIKEKGPLKGRDPNAVKSKKSPELEAKIKKSIEESIKLSVAQKGDKTEKPSKPSNVQEGVLGRIDLSSDKIRKILDRKSSHAYEVEMAETEKLEMYFGNLEKKEQMEEKMIATTEIVCDVVSCKECKYTAHQAAERCKDENHPLRCHKAIKRFFCCTECKRRTCAFTKFPKKSCSNCGSSSFERTGMKKAHSGPKLENETLKIRGDEIKFLSSAYRP